MQPYKEMPCTKGNCIT